MEHTPASVFENALRRDAQASGLLWRTLVGFIQAARWQLRSRDKSPDSIEVAISLLLALRGAVALFWQQVDRISQAELIFEDTLDILLKHGLKPDAIPPLVRWADLDQETKCAIRALVETLLADRMSEYLPADQNDLLSRSSTDIAGGLSLQDMSCPVGEERLWAAMFAMRWVFPEPVTTHTDRTNADDAE